jgi:DNA-binding transcriptional LysR family regulator
MWAGRLEVLPVLVLLYPGIIACAAWAWSTGMTGPSSPNTPHAPTPAPESATDCPGVVDRILHAQGLQRRIALRVPQFASALEVIAQSDLVLTAPSSLSNCSAASTLASRPAPLDIPEHAITMIWHPRFTEDPAHRWLRQLMLDVTHEVPSLPPKTRPKQPAVRPHQP